MKRPIQRGSIAFAASSLGLGYALALLVVQGAACVDGTTPDCSDANANCGPSIDGAVEAGEASSDSALQDSARQDGAGDAGSDVDAAATDADAASDAAGGG
jgi:hypothetical protein